MGVVRGWEGRSTWVPPPRDKLWIRPCQQPAARRSVRRTAHSSSRLQRRPINNLPGTGLRELAARPAGHFFVGPTQTRSVALRRCCLCRTAPSVVNMPIRTNKFLFGCRQRAHGLESINVLHGVFLQSFFRPCS